MLPSTIATRYVTPLREGGSLPAIMECDDATLRVVKFRAAGQGPRALIAEVIAASLGRQLGLPIPALSQVELDAALGRAEPDPEIRDLLVGSAGINLGMEYLAGAVNFDAAARVPVDPGLASAILAFDAYITNVDRTARNPNLMWWRDSLWLIDHGASLYAHHADGFVARAPSPFTPVRAHVLLPAADALDAAVATLRTTLTDDAIAAAVADIPSAWLDAAPPAADYIAYLTARRDAATIWLEEAARARASLV
jgi:HipA-like protein